MRLAIEEGEDQIYVMCDSSYAMNACENHHEKSLNRTWYNQNGSRMLNQSVIKDIYHLFNEVEVSSAKKIQFKLEFNSRFDSRRWLHTMATMATRKPMVWHVKAVDYH